VRSSRLLPEQSRSKDNFETNPENASQLRGIFMFKRFCFADLHMIIHGVKRRLFDWSFHADNLCLPQTRTMKKITLTTLVVLALCAQTQQSFGQALWRYLLPVSHANDTSAGVAGKGSLAIKLTPITLLRNMMFTGHVEYAVSPSVSLCLGASPNLLPKDIGFEAEDLDTTGYCYEWTLEGAKSGFSIDPEFRWYSDRMMDGFYLGLYSSVRLSRAQFNEYDNCIELYDSSTGLTETYGSPTNKQLTMDAMVIVAGPQFGWSSLLGKKKHFIYDLYFGVGGKMTNRKYSGEFDGPGYQDSSNIGLALRGNFSLGYRFN